MSSPQFRVFRPESPFGYRFGPFTFDLRSAQLEKRGVRIKARQQSLQILEILLGRAGEVVLRDEIRVALWPADTVVEFDRSINTAMQRLREALSESAENPKYIETLARKGYRFIAPVERIEVSAAQPVVSSGAALEPRPLDERMSDSKPSAHRRIAELIIGLVLIVIGIIGWFRPQSFNSPNWMFRVDVPGYASVSPDGAKLLWVRGDQLLLRFANSLSETVVYSDARITGHAAWSWDGSQALVQTNSGLLRIPLPNGPHVVLWPGARITRGYSWGPDGSVLVAVLDAPRYGSLYLIEAGAAKPTRLDIPTLTGGRFYWPDFLPDRKHFLFTWAQEDDEEAGIYLGELRNGKITGSPVLLRHNKTAGLAGQAADSWLLFVHDSALYAQKLDIGGQKLIGDPRKIAPDVASNSATRRPLFDVSRTGVLAWRRGRSGRTQLTWFDRRGNVTGTAGPAGDLLSVRLAPDARHLLLDVDAGANGVLEPGQSSYRKLPQVAGAIWSTDGYHVLHIPSSGGKILERDIALGTDQELLGNDSFGRLLAISPDGKYLLYAAGEQTIAAPLNRPPGSAKPRILLRERAFHAAFSPDGSWIVYDSYVPSVRRNEIFTRTFDNAVLPHQLSTDGGSCPVWRQDGREIAFIKSNSVMSVGVRADLNGPVFETAKALFQVRIPAGLLGDSQPLAVTPDGSRFLFAQASDAVPEGEFVMTAWDQVIR